MKPRFLLDENIGLAIQHQLRRLEPQIEVIRIGDQFAPPCGTLDPEILDWIEQTGYILVTGNRRSMSIHLADHRAEGGHFPGVLWIRSDTTIGQLVEEIHLIWAASEANEYLNLTRYIPL